MKIVADTNTFIAVALNEPEKETIIRLTKGHNLAAPEVLPFEIGNALSAMLKRKVLKTDEMISVWEVVRQIPVELQVVTYIPHLVDRVFRSFYRHVFFKSTPLGPFLEG